MSWDGLGPAPVLCPHCGGTIDSRLGELETPTAEYTRPLTGEPPQGGTKSGEAQRWTQAWREGSLGKIGRYQLRELLGDGGFGQVFQAYDPRLDRDVALKVLKQEDPGERVKERFFREARAAARLKHPNIVSVLDSGCDAGRCWIVYELVRGRTLDRHRDQGKADRAAAVRIVRDLADALGHAHQQGVFHRDLKPANVIVDGDGAPHLTDFGLAKRSDLDSDLTQDGAMIGTPAYMSPEQAGGRSRQADERSDVFSLGMIFYELLLGRRAAEPPDAVPAWRTRAVAPPPPPRSLDRTIPAALDRICMRALAADPAARYPSAGALADDLDRWLREQKRARRGPRAKRALAAVLAVAVLVAAGLSFRLVGGSSAPRRDGPLDPHQPAAPGIVEPAPGAEGRPRADVAAEGAVVVTPSSSRHSNKFHHPTCSHLHSSARDGWTWFGSEEEARAAGYEPCSHYVPR